MIFSLINQYCAYIPTSYYILALFDYNTRNKRYILSVFMQIYTLMHFYANILVKSNEEDIINAALMRRSKNTFPCVTNIEKIFRRYLKIGYKKYMRHKKDDVTKKYHIIKT